MVEHRLPKPRVAGSSPVSRSGDGEQPKFGCSLFFLCLCSCKPDHHPKNSAALQLSPSLQRQGEYLRVAGILLYIMLGLSTCAIWHPRFTTLARGGRAPFPAPEMASNQSLVVRCFLMCVICWLDIAYCQL